MVIARVDKPVVTLKSGREKKKRQNPLRNRLANPDVAPASLPYCCEGKKVSPASVTQEVTLTKSATKEGITHFKMAAFPRITCSLFTSVSYCWLTTREGGGGEGGGKKSV